ncbi:MAG: 1,4-alpha-glucan branching protein GlgB [Pirellulaceae bacterium]|nr:1,4-alpha-glucan branching protein GlgB [Pirellulaceae bacterium]
MRTNVQIESISALIEGRHENPFEVLGPHEVQHDGRRALAIRAFLPSAKQAWVLHPTHETAKPMRRIHPSGVYEALCPVDDTASSTYQLQYASGQGEILTMHDPYAFEPYLTEYDLYLFGEGTHWHIYDKLGAQLREIDGVCGVNFAVWAPNARGVSVVGDFNGWDGRQHPMRKHVPSGVWELFVPDIGSGEKYKYRVFMEHESVDKSDPFGFAAELPPMTASCVTNLTDYRWNDQQWLDRRRETNPLDQPVSVYEVHLGSWRKDSERPHGWLNYRNLAHQLVDYCHQMGYTHIELLPVSEHPFTGSWGYQTVGYFAATSRYGTPEDFMYFVDYCHQHNIGVIIDWVPAHFPRDSHGLREFDGSPLYEHADPRQGEHPDWGTMIFNYGRHEVRNFLLGNALFWLDKYHIDGLRVDAVASMLYLDYSREEGQWIPNQFGGRENLEAVALLRDFNEQLHWKFPGVLTIAEESTSYVGVSRPTETGGLGFSLKWNMGWMNDTLRYMRHEPIHRSHHHGELSFSLIYAFTENFALPLSHDEVVHGKGSLLDQMPGDLWQKFANLRVLYSYMWTHPGKKVIFMGSDFGQWTEWNCDESLQWDLLQWESHQGLQRLVADLNGMYRREPSLYELDFDGHGFEWIDCSNYGDSVFSYIRKAKNPDDFLVVATNFTPVVRTDFRLGVPRAGWYSEIFNGDSEHYQGSNVGNYPGVQAVQEESHGREHSILITVPPLATVVFKPQ